MGSPAADGNASTARDSNMTVRYSTSSIKISSLANFEMKVFRDQLKALEPTVTQILAISGSPGLSLGVLHQGNIIHTAHFGRRDCSDPEPPNDDTVYRVASLTKVLTSSAVALLIDEGILSWDTPIREYLPTFGQRTDELGQKATVKDLLSNRTGLAVADLLWGQQYGEFLLPRSELVRTTTFLEAVKPFREKFFYTQWNYGLVTEVVEAVTGKTLGSYIKEKILDPMEMRRTTLGKTKGENIAVGHAIRNEGRPCKIGFPNMDDGVGLAGGYAGKSSVKDVLRMYQGILHAKKDQSQTGLDSSPGSPFKHTRTIFSPHIPVAASKIDDAAYCLGLYRTRLPGMLGTASINNMLLSPKALRPSGMSSPGVEIYHHTGNLPGFLASAFLIPSTETAVVVLTNSMALMDPTNLVGQLIVSVLIGEEPPNNFPELARTARSAMLGAYQKLAATLEKGKTAKPPRSPISGYEGHYWNAARNYCISIAARPRGLLMTVQGAPRTTYNLEPYDGDTFYWPTDREDEMCERGMPPRIYPWWHKVMFGMGDDGRISHLTWHHDPLAKPEVFQRSETPPQKLWARL
jgi:CubicO group peptidase (beta-lactamase class C family)